jgi:hypothetical protein
MVYEILRMRRNPTSIFWFDIKNFNLPEYTTINKPHKPPWNKFSAVATTRGTRAKHCSPGSNTKSD